MLQSPSLRNGAGFIHLSSQPKIPSMVELVSFTWAVSLNWVPGNVLISKGSRRLSVSSVHRDPAGLTAPRPYSQRGPFERDCLLHVTTCWPNMNNTFTFA